VKVLVNFFDSLYFIIHYGVLYNINTSGANAKTHTAKSMTLSQVFFGY